MKKEFPPKPPVCPCVDCPQCDHCKPSLCLMRRQWAEIRTDPKYQTDRSPCDTCHRNAHQCSDFCNIWQAWFTYKWQRGQRRATRWLAEIAAYKRQKGGDGQ